MSSVLRLSQRIIEYSFYLLFFLVPLVFTDKTSELFEFNKMWLTFALTVVILFTWVVRSIAQKRFFIKGTPLDIPILIFLIGNVVSTIISIEPHTSLWGYYSRFNGGLFSILSYIALFYAFVSNFVGEERIRVAKRIIFWGFFSGIIVALWGLPSHFGYDPTCFVFRGTFDVSCWTEAFQPKVRIFSTLGQPAWLAAFLGIMIPISLGYFVNKAFTSKEEIKKLSPRFLKNKHLLIVVGYLLAAILFYADLIFTNTRSGFLGFWAGNFIFWAGLFFLSKPKKPFKKNTVLRLGLLVNGVFLLLTFAFGSPISQINRLTYSGLFQTSQQQEQDKPAEQTTTPSTELGGTDSGQIRLFVWRGALEIFKQNPLFGTGAETFAFSYYKVKPLGHNLTSEWDYLYNKAHNEYLNYLSTTGIVGFSGYVSFIGLFLFLIFKRLKEKISTLSFEIILSLALVSAFITILISNFFGFSVVIINLYFFLIPLFVLSLLGIENDREIGFPKDSDKNEKLSLFQWGWIAVSFIIAMYSLLLLLRFWMADTAYALGYNLDRAGQYQEANPHLQRAVLLRPSEPLFKDELSINMAVIAAALLFQNQATDAAQLRDSAIALSDEVVTNHPNNIVFYKTRVRVFYTLSQVDPSFLPKALEAIEKTKELAPTDAKVRYNLAVIYGQNGDTEKAIEELRKTIELKPDYRDAYYALGLFYRDLAVNPSTGQVVNEQMQKNAADQMRYILENINPEDQPAKDALEAWGAESFSQLP